MMKSRKRVAALAACVGMVCAGNALATTYGDDLSLNRPIYAAASDRPLLMRTLDNAGVGGYLDDAGITIGGWVEVSWTHNFNDPVANFNLGRSFDLEHDDPTFNQAVIFVDRTIEASPTEFNVGGRMEWMWGGDARFIHSNGLFDHYGFGDGPDEQFDLTQAYLTFNIPVGNGLLVTAGKWVTLLGYETINPTTNPLYSHSYLFGFAIPFTHTGVLATYQFDRNWSASFGIVRGWDQSLEDNNSQALSYIGQVKWTTENLDIIVNGITGPEQFDSDSDYRSVVDVILVYREGDQWTFVLNADYGYESSADPSDGSDAQWWGAAGYAIYKINDMFTAVGRLEFFNDDEGARGLGREVMEATFGVNVRPFPNHETGQALLLRPEIRYDWSSDELFDGLTDEGQVTFGVDAIFAF